MKFRLMAAMGLLMLMPAQPVFSQSGRTAASRSQDLWGVWREGFSHYEKAEKARTDKKYEDALNKYHASLQAFQKVRRMDSDWNKSVIAYRIDLCLRRIDMMQDAQTAAAKTKTKPAPNVTVQEKAKPILKQVIQREDFVEQSMKARARLAEAEKEITALKRSIDMNTKAAQQVTSLIQEKNELIQKNAAINLLLENTKARLAKVDKNAEKDKRIVEEKAKVTALTNQLKNMRVEMETLKLQKAEAQNRRNEAELALKQNVQSITTLTAALEAAKTVRKENKVLIAQLAEMKKDRMELERKQADSIKRISELTSQLAKIRDGIDLPENIRKIQDNANVVLKDNEYLRTLNTKNMKELELLKKSNQIAGDELKKISALYTQNAKERETVEKIALESKIKLDIAEKASATYRNSIDLLQKERDGLKKDLSAFAEKYESLLKAASKSDSLSAELLKREAELKTLADKSTRLDLTLTKLRQENAALTEAVKKANRETQELKARMEKQYTALKLNSNRISAENAKLKTETDALKLSLAKTAEIEKKTAQLSAENVQLKKEATALKTSIEKFGRESAAGKMLSSENSTLKTKSSALENELKQALAEKTALASEYAKLKLRAGDLQKNFEKIAAERAKLADKNRELFRTSAEAKEGAAKYAETVKNSIRLSEEYTKLKNDFEAFKNAIEKTNKATFSATKLSAENETLKKEAVALKATLDALKKVSGTEKKNFAAENARLKNEFEALKTKFEKTAIVSGSETKKSAEETVRLKQKYEALKLSLAGTDVEKMKRELETLKALSRKSEQLLAENDKLKKEAVELKTSAMKYQKLPDHAESALKENKALKEEIATLKNSVVRLTKLTETPQTSPRQIEQTLSENSTLKNETAKLKKHITMLNDELRENESLRKNNEEQIKKLLVSAKTSEEFLNQRDAKIKTLSTELAALKKRSGTSVSKEIATLSATVTELKEGKAQFESALRNLTAAKGKLENDNKKLKISLELAQRETDALKKQLTLPQPQGVVERKNLELLEASTKFEKLYHNTTKERDELSVRLKSLDKEIIASKNQLAAANVSMERMRKELQQWTDDPSGMSDQTIHRKDLAIDVLVKEGEDLRKELARIKTQLLVSDDNARRYKEKTVEMEQRIQLVLASIKDYKNLNPSRVLAAEQKKLEAELAEEQRKLTKHQELIARSEKQKAQKAADAKKAAKIAKTLPEKPSYDKKKFDESMTMALNAEKNKDSAGALMNYWRAADANPTSTAAYLGLAKTYLGRGEAASAAKAYETARKLGASQDKEFELKLNAGSN